MGKIPLFSGEIDDNFSKNISRCKIKKEDSHQRAKMEVVMKKTAEKNTESADEQYDVFSKEYDDEKNLDDEYDDDFDDDFDDEDDEMLGFENGDDYEESEKDDKGEGGDAGQPESSKESDEEIEKERREAEEKAAQELAEKQRNAEFARQRRERELEAKLAEARNEARIQAIIDAVGKNPWTSKEIKDAEDVEEYLTMKEIDSKGGNPVEDYPEKLKEKNRAAKAANSDGGEKSEESVEAWFREDAKDFSQKHPELTDADRKRLFEDKSFLRYGQGKFGSEPMASIYEGYMALVEGIKAEQAARERRAEANKQSSPGSLKSGTTETPYYTREELQRMSAAEVRRNYDKVMRSMERLPR